MNILPKWFVSLGSSSNKSLSLTKIG
jgi:hypothetical protein